MAELEKLVPGEKEMALILAFNRYAIPGFRVAKVAQRLGMLRGGKEPILSRGEVSAVGFVLEKKGLVESVKGAWKIVGNWAWVLVRYGVQDVEEIQRYEKALNIEYPYTMWDLGRLGFGLRQRILQFGLLTGDSYQLRDVLFSDWHTQGDDLNETRAWLEEILTDPIDEALLQLHAPQTRVLLIIQILNRKVSQLEPLSDLLDYVLANLKKIPAATAKYPYEEIVSLRLQQGHPGLSLQAAAALEDPGGGLEMLAQAVASFWANDIASADKLFTTASRKLKARGLFDGIAGVWHAWMALSKRDFPKVIRYAEKEREELLLQYLYAVAMHQENQTELAERILQHLPPETPVQLLVYIAAHYWCDIHLPEFRLVALQELFVNLDSGTYPFLAQLSEELVAYYLPKVQRPATWTKPVGIAPILDRIPRFEAWERALEGLADLTTQGGNTPKPSAETRLIWRINIEGEHLQPVLQKMGKTGSWSKGRVVSLKRLQAGEVTGLTPQDQRVVNQIQSNSSWYYGSQELELPFGKAIPLLVGHPLLFLANSPKVSLELVAREVELIVTERKGEYILSLEPVPLGPGIQLIRETSTRYQVVEVSSSHWQIFSLIRQGKLRVPATGRKKLEQVLGNIATVVRVQSDLVGTTENIREVEADSRPHILILPLGDGFKIEVFSKPFGTDAPYLKPGKGRSKLIAELNGEQLSTERNLNAEKKAAKALLAASMTLQRNVEQDWEWYLEEQEDCLNLLLELDPLRREQKVVIEWPKGEKLKLAGQADFGQLSLKVKGRQDWFKLEGNLKVNEDQVLQLQDLFSLLEAAPDASFITLDDGRFMALTEQLRKHLKELAAYTQEGKGGLGLHPLMAENLDEFGALGAELKANAAWKKQVKRLKEAREYQPQFPYGFQADLRPYQEEGYNWMARLAHWGVGACLADDMGLGKTVQALALLYQRASRGPALVVAPASVVRNWRSEAEKFAPELNPILLSEVNRNETIAELKEFDLLLVSYTLLQIESEKLSAVNFGSIVLDEAQAIKNTQTKRSKAAKELQGEFRLITTGTPIENHLGELWNLFDFLNPGYLSSAEHFNERFATPIEKGQNAEKRQQLRKLLRPFILRRRKAEVLEDLPEKTEITLHVELTEGEKNFYEALRRSALDRLTQAEGDNAGAQHLKILAEITRLRQAACHPALVSPEVELTSSKLKLFGETMLELRSNGHKALVFSQFVKHLALVRDWLDEQGISYQYLDGQTPLKKREERVNAFQKGEGDVFLISLKAGGVGLNLTAADYVIHMDPWWNPAVEDQASDRAHRIGQQRPVTVYRLVSENTIEEKIVRLHQEKRDLADSLLEGTDSGARMSSDELLALITEG